VAQKKLSRETLLPKLAAYVLEHGLDSLSLRPLAKAAGTSDRMLIYHFGSKDQLVADLLGHLAQMFAAGLDAAMPKGRSASRQDCFEQVIEATAQPDFAPFFQLWWDIVAGCARGNTAYLASAGTIMDLLLEWVANHLPADDPDPETGARMVLTMIEGSQMMGAIGRKSIAQGVGNTLNS